MWELLSYEKRAGKVKITIQDWDLSTGEVMNIRPFGEFPSLSVASTFARMSGFTVTWAIDYAAIKDAWCATREVHPC